MQRESESRRAIRSQIKKKKKDAARFKIVESLVFILPPAAAVFDVNDTENARFQATLGRNFLSLFSFFFFGSANWKSCDKKCDERQRRAVELVISQQVRKCIFHITACCHENITSCSSVDSRVAMSS